MADWHLYVVRAADGTLYTGIATDVERRLAEHRKGSGAKYLRGRGPLELVFRCAIGERGEALRVEAAVKALSKAEKEELVEGDADRNTLTSLLVISTEGERSEP